MDEDYKREFIENYISDLLLDAQFSDVASVLWDQKISDPDLTRELWARIRNAKVEVKFD